VGVDVVRSRMDCVDWGMRGGGSGVRKGWVTKKTKKKRYKYPWDAMDAIESIGQTELVGPCERARETGLILTPS